MSTNHFYLPGVAVLVCCAGIAQGAVVFQDGFEGYDVGVAIDGQTPPAGGWGSEVLAGTGFTVRASPSGGGQALQGNRTPAVHGGFVSARTFAAPQPDTQLVIKWDAYRVDAGSTSAVQALYIGTTFFADSTVLVSDISQQILYHNGASYTNSGVSSAYGGWESYEMVITFGPDEGGGHFHATYDLSLERTDPGSNLGVLAKTAIATDVAFYSAGFTDAITNMRWMTGMNPHTSPVGNSTVYYDNLSMQVVPEPLGLGVVGAVGVVKLLSRRRRQA